MAFFSSSGILVSAIRVPRLHLASHQIFEAVLQSIACRVQSLVVLIKSVGEKCGSAPCFRNYSNFMVNSN